MQRVIISGGGTGGHIFPAISIANAIKKRYPEVDIRFVGAEDRMEMQRVPAAGYPITGLPVAGFDRKNIFRNIPVFFKLLASLRKARKIVKEFNPQVAVGVGGYASGPTLKAANKLGIPTLIQEQNSYAGVTNKLLAKKAAKICVAYEHMERFFPAEKIVLTGNPVRADLTVTPEKREEGVKFFGLDPAKKTVLVVGGSLGARTVNQGMIKGLDKIQGENVQFIWQAGKHYIDESRKALEAYPGIPVYLTDFISRMDLAFSVADLIVSRAGAGSISEFCILGKPVVLIPSPNVAEDHQRKNAQALVDKGAAVMIPDSEAEEKLVDMAITMVADTEQLMQLSRNILQMALPDAADKIVDEIEKIIKN